MSLEQYANFSNYSVASATVVLSLACLAYIAEWAFTRQVTSARRRDRAAQRALVTTGAGDSGATASVAPTNDTSAADAEYRRELAARIGLSLTVLAFALLVVGVVTRSLASGEFRAPWGNMYEFSMVGITAVIGMFLVMVKLADVNWLGGIVTAFAVIVLGLSMLVYVPAGPLVPALDSYWLVIHVIAAMISAGAFAIGAALSVLYLVRARAEAKTPDIDDREGYIWRLPTAAKMDRLSYRIHAFAFPLYTFAALIAGPIWAYHAWGRAWGWDPKEVWAFITWVAYACYLHARATAGWKGKAAAILALVAFATFMFNYVGVNLFIDGMHSYAK
ncbi:c-type cytochrome biogenesis protein CcsB [Solicola gregarius]|uniref:C-type cytochrome biogenesis protein CcsB n=1 Tax=Solicola gregarius TaxID=2908642 RepID=A0AA46TKC3_9ACTN|nr:c-type cytochrome biogenesis protein CcsB [Solicola gregarius]UYM06924.1 c-type cytochrome biogenesis protein CcsB [Solicola gregarius]